MQHRGGKMPGIFRRNRKFGEVDRDTRSCDGRESSAAASQTHEREISSQTGVWTPHPLRKSSRDLRSLRVGSPLCHELAVGLPNRGLPMEASAPDPGHSQFSRTTRPASADKTPHFTLGAPKVQTRSGCETTPAIVARAPPSEWPVKIQGRGSSARVGQSFGQTRLKKT